MENYIKTKNDRRVDVYFNSNLFQMLDEYCKKKNATWAEVIRHALREYLKENLPKE